MTTYRTHLNYIFLFINLNLTFFYVRRVFVLKVKLSLQTYFLNGNIDRKRLAIPYILNWLSAFDKN